jgi:mRNA interferase RelE/StbE
LSHPQYRLRIDDVRVFYDIRESTVEILAIVIKSEAEKWLAESATPEAENGKADEESGTV